MKEPKYGEALRASWKLSWQHKSLWSFGLFAMLLGQLGISELLLKLGMASSTFQTGGFWPYLVFFLNPKTWISAAKAGEFGPDRVVWMIWLILILAAVFAFLLFIATVCQGAIVHAAAKYSKRASSFPDERKSWHAGVKHFWRVLSLNIARKIAFFLMALLVVWSTFNALISASFSDSLLFILIFILAAVFGMILSLLLIYAVAYVIVEEYSFGEAISSAWKLFVNHWLVSFEVGFSLLVLNIVAIILVVAGFLYLFLLPVVVATYISSVFGGLVLFKVAVFIGYVFFVVFAISISAIFTVFVTSVWTHLFVKMHKVGVKSKILHLFRK